ncbi:MAG: ribosome biogenesis GTP-binding protein YihA/YsxC [Christensenellales bacterium]|jgi:GTP-binding protein
MIVKNAKFLTSVASASNLLKDDVPEIAFVGRSNVGKSSLINALTNQNKLAKTSQTPGRTRLVNYFAVNNDTVRFVDLPGYGYAKASKESQKEWSSLIGDYLLKSKNLKLLFLLVDVRHTPNNLDVMMQEFAFNNQIPCVIIATKSDKIAKSKLPVYIKEIASTLKVGTANIFPFSSETKVGKTQILDKIDQFIN